MARRTTFARVAAAVIGLAFTVLGQASAQAPRELEYNRNIRPILSETR